MKNEFSIVAANENNEKYNKMIQREFELYKDNLDLRSEFERDYTRIIHSNAYRRLKHKTQVFFSPENDHVCTRIEHVTHVESISYTIAKYLGLNTELTKAIATAHDLGHSPFGHKGEKILSEISEREFGERFWHEQNGLHLVDNFELLEDRNGFKQNMNLTYAVRDGIISHCGEVDQNALKPRDNFIDLNIYKKPNEYSPYTWEGCIVKIADKISYIGRDIEDAIRLGILDNNLEELYEILNLNMEEKINNTAIINKLVSDLVLNSSIQDGLCFSNEALQTINKIKAFNYKNIYNNERLLQGNEYFSMVINKIYNYLERLYDKDKIKVILEKKSKVYPKLVKTFMEWIKNFWNLEDRSESNLKNKVIFDMNNFKDYKKAIVYFISGMTDRFAMEVYKEIISF